MAEFILVRNDGYPLRYWTGKWWSNRPEEAKRWASKSSVRVTISRMCKQDPECKELKMSLEEIE